MTEARVGMANETTMMTSEQRELLRRAILRVLEANNTRFGLGVEAVRNALVMFGFQGAEAGTVADEIGYLVDKGLVEEVLKKISRENRAWRITRDGMAFLDGGG